MNFGQLKNMTVTHKTMFTAKQAKNTHPKIRVAWDTDPWECVLTASDQ